VVSQDTLGHTIIRSSIKSLGSRNKSQRQVSLALNLPYLIMLFGRKKWHYPQRGSPSCHPCGKYGYTKAECFELKLHKPKEHQIYEGLVSMMKSVLVRLDKLDIAHNIASQVNKVWARKDETIHPLRGSGLTW
jgi:hypothetical protein